MKQIDNMTIKQLRAIPYEEAVTFKLPTARDIMNAASLAYKAQHVMGCRFSTKCDYEASTLIITKKRKED